MYCKYIVLSVVDKNGLKVYFYFFSYISPKNLTDLTDFTDFLQLTATDSGHVVSATYLTISRLQRHRIALTWTYNFQVEKLYDSISVKRTWHSNLSIFYIMVSLLRA